MSKLKDAILGHKYLSWLQLFTNWLMQGIYHSDKSERLYKSLFTIFFWIILFLILFFLVGLSLTTSLILGFIGGHTVNWVINNNLFVLLIHRMRWLKTTKSALFNQLESIQKRLEKTSNKDWLLFSVSHGGICNGTLNQHSDIDVTLIRKPGLKNMIKAILFYVKEKKYADVNGIPLDIFICDSPEDCIKKCGGQKNPIVLLDHNNQVDIYYPDKLKMTIDEAKVLNGEVPSK